MRILDVNCNKCNSIMRANVELPRIQCNYCGTMFQVDSNGNIIGEAYPAYTQMAANGKAPKEKKKMSGVKIFFITLAVICSLFILGFVGLVCLGLAIDDEYKEIPFTQEEIVGLNCEEVMLRLQDAGFLNVQMREVEEKSDLYVDYITVLGKYEYDSEEFFEVNSAIAIYH